MTKDTVPVHCPTESFVLASPRRFFPLNIPNFHRQLRHYISTADPDRIYVVVDRIVCSIHVLLQTQESIAVLPFEPRCMWAGYGWIAVGGPDDGECAFIKIADHRGLSDETIAGSRRADVNSALPIDLDASGRVPPSASLEDVPDASRRSRTRRLPDVQPHKFGGSIVNSVTIHRFAGDDKGFADEDVAVLSNNDCTVTIYSLTRAKVLQVIPHPACMNFAIVSPDSTILAAVGDEDVAYFYEISRVFDFDSWSPGDNDEKLTGWEWTLLREIHMDIVNGPDDPCCFTIAFSPSSRFCAVGSQSGDIHVFDVMKIRNTEHPANDPVICRFQSSKPYSSGGAVRCMTFSAEPWDLLVWIEDRGRAGIADIRSGFSRRQILDLDRHQPAIQEVTTELVDQADLGRDDELPNFTELRDEMDRQRRVILDLLDRSAQLATNDGREGSSADRESGNSNRRLIRDALLQDPDLTDRERLIIEFLNTARWGSGRSQRNVEQAHPGDHTNERLSDSRGSTEPVRVPRPTSPLPSTNVHSGRPSGNNRNTTTRPPNTSTNPQPSNLDPSHRNGELSATSTEAQPNFTINWGSLPFELHLGSIGANRTPHRPPNSYAYRSNWIGENTTNTRTQGTVGALTTVHAPTSSRETRNRQRSERSNSTQRQSDRRANGVLESRIELTRLLDTELRTNVSAERLRRQRQAPLDAHGVRHEWDQPHRRHLRSDQARFSRWRGTPTEISDQILNNSNRDLDSSGAAGVGWGADGRTLYIATIQGIFEYHINTLDRKTFPVQAYR